MTINLWFRKIRNYVKKTRDLERNYQKMKPNVRILDYVALIQEGCMTLDDVPQDIKQSVTKWVRHLSGVVDDGMVKDTAVSQYAPKGGVVNPTKNVIVGEASGKEIADKVNNQVKKVFSDDSGSIN